MPRVLLFDINLTMVKTQGAGRAAMELAFAREFGIEKATEGILFDGRADRGIFFETLERQGLGGEALIPNYARFAEAYLELLPRSSRRAAAWSSPASMTCWQPSKPGTMRFPAWPRGTCAAAPRTNWATSVSGNGSPAAASAMTTLHADLVRAGIEELAGLFSFDPDPANVIVLGDTPLDVEAAHAAGATALGAATGDSGVEELKASGAEFAVQDFSDTRAVLEMLLS